jgi:peptidoglycan/xylan/chitin deacetylase (PgdA/CDA1 family)
MDLVVFSVRTKGVHNFGRRIWTVFARFGLSDARTRRALYSIMDSVGAHNAAPTFFIPAVVLRRHALLLAEVARSGAEIGVHGYVHNDYRFLSACEQHKQTEQAITVFRGAGIPYHGFRNPYFGWTQDSLGIFASLGFTYESNEAVLHDVIDRDRLPPLLRRGFDKSLRLFQAMPCTTYTLRPHLEGPLVRIPTSIPDDEMLFDRLRITDATCIGHIWSSVMQKVYDHGGLYVLNLHPERAILCNEALAALLRYARSRPLPVWLARLQDIAQWWQERSQFRVTIVPQGPGRWRIESTATPRATLLARHLVIEDQPTIPWLGREVRIQARCCTVRAPQCPCIGLSPRTAQSVYEFLLEQGYPAVFCPREEAQAYALYVDEPDGLGTTREEQVRRRSALVEQIEQMEAPLLHFGNWPSGSRAALAISGDVDSVTIQDFFLRIHEVHRYT